MELPVVQFNTAKLAKEKGFDWDTNAKLPTLELLKMWLREVHKIEVSVIREEDYWIPNITEFAHGNKHIPFGYSQNLTFEQAIEAGLVKALNLIPSI